MTSKRQVEANRRNAQRSTGPKSPDGIKRASLNATKMGLYAKTLILPGENKKLHDHLVADVQRQFEPKGAIEEIFVQRLIGYLVLLNRLDLAENAPLRNPREDPFDVALQSLEEDRSGSAQLEETLLAAYVLGENATIMAKIEKMRSSTIKELLRIKKELELEQKKRLTIDASKEPSSDGEQSTAGLAAGPEHSSGLKLIKGHRLTNDASTGPDASSDADPPPE